MKDPLYRCTEFRILLEKEKTEKAWHGVWFVDTIPLLGVAGRARAAKQSNNQSPKR